MLFLLCIRSIIFTINLFFKLGVLLITYLFIFKENPKFKSDLDLGAGIWLGTDGHLLL